MGMALIMKDIHMVQFFAAGASVAGAAVVLGICAYLAFYQVAWRRFPNVMLSCYSLSCLVYGALVFTPTCNIVFRTLFTFFQMQCRCAVMTFLWSIGLKSVSKRTSWWL